tara:strand:+ start:1329 stop:2168 length:840 start_codon:yes stop_codon:yes gene_type:complete
MDKIDLNINNYELSDLLKLFNLSYNFTEVELKNAKKIVLKTHPDKSKLSKEYFLFFSKAYKIIYSIYEFRIKGNGPTEYIRDENENQVIKNISKKENFNKIFNDLFDKYNINDEEIENGYGDWLKSDEDLDKTVTTKENMNITFNKMKESASKTIVNNNYEETVSMNYKSLTGNAPVMYSSDLFSSLPYEDLRKAHVENVIPVTDKNIKIFKNIEELQKYRETQTIKPYSMSESKNILKKTKEHDLRDSTERAYKLAKQDEMYKEINKQFMSNLYKLTN